MKKRRKKPNQGLTEIRPKHQVPADSSQQAPNNSYSPPTYYEDVDFNCVDCGRRSTWSAEQQKQYYEEWKNPIYGTAKHCRGCRRKRRTDKERQQNQRNNDEPNV